MRFVKESTPTLSNYSSGCNVSFGSWCLQNERTRGEERGREESFGSWFLLKRGQTAKERQVDIVTSHVVRFEHVTTEQSHVRSGA